jgi:ribonuclease P protein component
MLATVNTLKDKRDYEKVKKEGTLYQSENFGVSILDRGNGGYTRFGIIVSNKISKLSTQRNRIKRAFRDALRYNLNRIKDGYDVVFLAKPSLERTAVSDIMKEIDIFVRDSVLVKSEK